MQLELQLMFHLHAALQNLLNYHKNESVTVANAALCIYYKMILRSTE